MKKYITLFIGLMFYTCVYSQFNTIKPSSIGQKMSPKITLQEENSAIDTIPLQYFPSRAQIEKLNRYRQREFIALPLDTCAITSSYGKRVAPNKDASTNHRGVDLRCNGDYVYSIMPGEISKRGYAQRIGNYIEVNHGDFRTIYGHLHSFLVQLNQSVEAGQPIAISGSTGNSTGPHLHFGVKYKKHYIDPKPILDFINSFSKTVKEDISNDIENELRKVR